eukprot:COSAG02_NODE_2141_length_9686_cov_3.045791_8_plen_305_part_00
MLLEALAWVAWFSFYAFWGSLFTMAVTSMAPVCAALCWKPQNLRAKYGMGDNGWAVVTGGSSGIGKAIVVMLAEQGINVVIVAVADATLEETTRELEERFWVAGIQFVAVGVDLSTPGSYMNAIRAATDTLPVQLVFSNAGYILTGFFSAMPIAAHLANLHCNATASVEIVHHFVGRMQAEGLRGGIAFTSSPASFMATPFTTMYGSTKAFLSEFGASLAPEIKSHGIDVCVVHPSPTASNFYDSKHVTHTIDAMDFFKKTACGPEKIAEAIFASLGRLVIVDQGWYPIALRALLKIVDVPFLT